MHPRWTTFAALLIALPVIALLAQTRPLRLVKRAQPPKFGKSDLFFADAFKEALVGQRPAALGTAARPEPAADSSAADAAPTAARPAAPAARPGTGWSRLISATTIEDAIKTLKLRVDQQVTTPTDFASKGHKLARRDFSMLAVLFAIAAEYDGDVRWKQDAAAARDAFARSAANLKVGTAQAFQEAKLRKEELSDLVGGSSPFAGKQAETKADWGQVAHRSPLMQYLEAAWEPRLKPALSDKGQFTAKADLVQQEAELFAALGQVLAKEGMPDADSHEYAAFAGRLRDGAKEVAEAVKARSYDRAAAASATIGKACAECHENYRG